MRRIISAVTALAFVALVAAPVFAADVTVKGELVDQACFLSKKEAGKARITLIARPAAQNAGRPSPSRPRMASSTP